MLYLDGVDSSDIDLMLDYIYHGEVQIHQEHLDRFLDGANKFKLEGLIGSDDEKPGEIQTENHKQFEEVEDLMQVEEPNLNDTKQQNFAKKTKKESALNVIQESPQMIDAGNMDIKQLYQELILREDGSFKCTVCFKTMGHKASMERHVEMHVTGLSYDCKHCGETFRSRVTLKHHVHNNH